MKWTIRILLTLLTLAWMIFVFNMSAEEGEKSGRKSDKTAEKIGEALHDDYEEWSEEEKTDYIERLKYPIRKSAHVLEYASLGILLYFTLLSWDIKGRKGLIVCFVMGVLYACTDEIHQLFVPDRAGQVTDVLLDSLGMWVGMTVSDRFRKRRKAQDVKE